MGENHVLKWSVLSIGQVVEFLKKAESKGCLSCDTVLKIFYQTCRAVQHMHKQKPPIIHRDLKVRCPQYQLCSWLAQWGISDFVTK